MNKKKVLSTLLVASMIVSLSACGSSSTSSSGGSAAASTGAASTAAASTAATTEFTSTDSHELTVWTWDPSFNIYAMQEAEKFYQEKDPEFKLTIVETQSDDIETKFVTAVSAGDMSTMPDIFLMQDNSYQKYIANYPEIFTDLTNSGIDFTQFGTAKQAYSTVDGHHYGVPFDNGAVIGCYRTDYLEQAGLTVDDFTDITWDQWIEKGSQVASSTGKSMLNSQAGSPDIIMMMLQSAGASLFNEDGSVNIVGNEPLKVALNYYKSAIDAGAITEVVDWDQYIAGLQGGTAASTINGCWIIASITAAADQSGKWAITNMPKLDGVDNATNYSNNGGSSWGVTSSCTNQTLAIDFLNETFGTNVAFYEDILPSSGALATYLPAADSDVYNSPQEFFGGEAIYAKIVDFAGKIPSNVTGAYYYDARDAVGVALSNYIQTGADLDAELETAQQTVEFNMGG